MKQKATFLKTKEFKQTVDDHAYSLFDACFNLFTQQVSEPGLLPKEMENLPDFEKALVSFPNFMSVDDKSGPENEESNNIDP